MSEVIVNIGPKTVHLYSTTGVVQEAGKRSETHVHGSGGGSALPMSGSHTTNVRITSTTTVHDDLFIVDDDGKEHAFQLQDFDVAVRKGNRITITHAIASNKQSGPYILVQNHSTRQHFFKKKRLRWMVRPNIWLSLGIGVVAAAVTFPILGCGSPLMLFAALGVGEGIGYMRVKNWLAGFNLETLAAPEPARLEAAAQTT